MTVTPIPSGGARASVLLPAFALALAGAAPMAASAQAVNDPDTPVGAVDAGEEAQQEAVEAQGASPSYPLFTYGVGAELENDYTFEADDPAAELNDLFPTIEGAFALEFQEGTGVFSTVVIEPVLDPTGDREFEDVGLYAEERMSASTPKSCSRPRPWDSSRSGAGSSTPPSVRPSKPRPASSAPTSPRITSGSAAAWRSPPRRAGASTRSRRRSTGRTGRC